MRPGMLRRTTRAKPRAVRLGRQVSAAACKNAVTCGKIERDTKGEGQGAPRQDAGRPLAPTPGRQAE